MNFLKRGFLSILLAAAAALPVAAADDSSAGKSASLELRIAADQFGCPVALEVWLRSTSDTIKAFETVIQWDRPDFVRFAPAKASKKKRTNLIDSLLSSPTGKPQTLVRIDTAGSLLSGWETVVASSVGDGTARVAALSSIQSMSKARYVLPGQSGRLCRLPVLPVAGPPSQIPGDTAYVWFNTMSTRVAGTQGDLFPQLKLTQAVVGTTGCGRPPRKQ